MDRDLTYTHIYICIHLYVQWLPKVLKCGEKSSLINNMKCTVWSQDVLVRLVYLYTNFLKCRTIRQQILYCLLHFFPTTLNISGSYCTYIGMYVCTHCPLFGMIYCMDRKIKVAVNWWTAEWTCTVLIDSVHHRVIEVHILILVYMKNWRALCLRAIN